MGKHTCKFTEMYGKGKGEILVLITVMYQYVQCKMNKINTKLSYWFVNLFSLIFHSRPFDHLMLDLYLDFFFVYRLGSRNLKTDSTC